MKFFFPGALTMIVPAKTMALLEKIGSHDKESVAVKVVENQVLIKYANVVVSSNLVEGNFPKYEDIIPGDHDKKLSLSTLGALSAVRRAALLTSEESKGVKLAVGKNALVFSGSSPEAGAAEVSMPIEYKGEPIRDLGPDGIPLSWKRKYGLDVNDAALAQKDLQGDGYTVMDKYLGGLVPTKKIDWSDPLGNVNNLK